MDVRIPRSKLIRPGELSRYVSRREPGSINHLWQPAAQSQQRNTDGANTTSQLAAAVNQALAGRPLSSSGMHPFKIYQLPFQYRTTPLADPSTAWRAVRVRNGLILNTTIDPTSGPCTGTDQVDQFYDDVFVTQADGTLITGVSDIIVPSGEPTYYIWLDVMGNSISYGDDPTAPDHGGAWASFPMADPNYVMIGWVDTDTLSSIGRAIIQQEQDTHVQATGGGAAGASTFHFATMFDNYFLTVEGVRIAKMETLRNDVTKEVATDGTVWTMTYATTGAIAYIHRAKVAGSVTEYQAVAPIYKVASSGVNPSEIYAFQPSGGTGIVTIAADTGVPTGTAVLWQELGPARLWCKKVDQSSI